jgi:branched-chain amino acid transport system permease protein
MIIGLVAQYVMNGLMLGMMYALVAVGFTLFFGVLDVIKFSHGDVLTVGAFTALATFVGLRGLGFNAQWFDLAVMLVAATLAMALLGMLIARYFVMPLRSAPALNTLLITLMIGTVLRESVRLFYPQGANPKPFPALLPRASFDFGSFNLRLDNVLMLAAGAGVIVGLQIVLNRTRLGLAIRAVAQDEETARTMGINFTAIVLVTFAIGSAMAAYAGLMNGLYYNEINFGIGLYLGVVGFSAAIIGGLGSVYGAILGGFLFAALQTVGAVVLPFASAYKDVFAFGVVILIMAWRPTGLIREKISERV